MREAINTGPVIEARELRKRYGARVALDGITLEVARGRIVGLLGPNGAGKTTTLSILSGVLASDSGIATICGHDLGTEPARARRMLGLAPQSLALYPTLTALENLDFFGRMQGLSAPLARAAALKLLDDVGLADRAGDLVGSFSGGMKRRLNLACGMLHEPAALLLDEPTAGVDPQSRERIFSVVKAAAAMGAGILYSTNYVEEAERLCEHIVLIDHGRIVARGTASELIEKAGAEPRIEIVTRAALQSGWSRALKGVREVPPPLDGGFRSALALSRLEQVAEVLRLLNETGAEVMEFRLHRPGLQDAFIALTGHALRDTH
jgi:linearmycin/streptolysin S transport system ATP-binding protein